MRRKIEPVISRVMGIDPALPGPCSFALSVATESGPSLLYWETEYYKGIKLRRCLYDCYEEKFRYLYDEWKPDLIVIEQNYGDYNVVRALTAVIVLTVRNSRCPVYSVPASHWKASVPKGHKKEHAIAYIETRFGMTLTTDEADAGCMSLYPFVHTGEKKWKRES